MSDSEFDIKYVANLAIALTPRRKPGSAPNWVTFWLREETGGLDVSDVEPMAHAVPLDNVLRADEVQPSITNEEALANAPKANGLFVVPKMSNDAARTLPHRTDGQARGQGSPPVRPCRRVSTASTPSMAVSTPS